MSDQLSGRALGLVSIAIGATELLAPRQLDRTMGIEDGENTGILRVLGVREIMHGFDLLVHNDPSPGLLGRVAGDVLDNVLMAAAFAKSRRPSGFGLIAAAVTPVVIADMACAATKSVETVKSIGGH
jgi:hypothetical protein